VSGFCTPPRQQWQTTGNYGCTQSRLVFIVFVCFSVCFYRRKYFRRFCTANLGPAFQIICNMQQSVGHCSLATPHHRTASNIQLMHMLAGTYPHTRVCRLRHSLAACQSPTSPFQNSPNAFPLQKPSVASSWCRASMMGACAVSAPGSRILAPSSAATPPRSSRTCTQQRYFANVIGSRRPACAR